MFNLVQFGTEIEALKKGAYVQTDLLAVDLSAVVTDKPIDIPAGATMLALVPLVLDRNGNQQTSDITHRVFVKLNSTSAPGIPFSLIPASGDKNVLNAALVRLYLTVPIASAGAKLYFVLGTGVGLASATGGPSGGGYSPTYGGGTSGGSSSSGAGSDSGGGGGQGGQQLL